jgi:hypothetical protein
MNVSIILRAPPYHIQMASMCSLKILNNLRINDWIGTVQCSESFLTSRSFHTLLLPKIEPTHLEAFP